MNLTEEQFADILRRQGKPAVDVPKASVKLPKPLMNKWETEYSYELEARRQAGEILWWGFEAMTLRLADRTRYTPDFAVLVCNGRGGEISHYLQFHECKGFWRDDARVKIKVAAEMFPFRFIAVRKRKGGGWDREEFRKR
jgi:hypothetical protein